MRVGRGPDDNEIIAAYRSLGHAAKLDCFIPTAITRRINLIFRPFERRGSMSHSVTHHGPAPMHAMVANRTGANHLAFSILHLFLHRADLLDDRIWCVLPDRRTQSGKEEGRTSSA